MGFFPMTKYLALAALAAVALPSAAFAQSSDSGTRFELFGGIDDFEDNRGAENDLFNPERDRDVDALVGANIGYDFVRGDKLRLGVDLEYVWTTAESPVFTNGVRNGDVDYGSEVYGGARLTYSLSPKFSLVGKLGYSLIDTEYNAAVAANSRDDNLSGIRGAIGFHFQESEESRSYYGLEARYTNYEQGLERKSAVIVVGHRF